jgi:hypothetical protein
MGDRTQRTDRLSLSRQRQGYCRTCGGIGGAHAGRHPRQCQSGGRGAATVNPHHPDRVRGGYRAGWFRRSGKYGATRRQCDRFCLGRIRHKREMAGAAQGVVSARDASGGAAGSDEWRSRAVCCNPERRGLVWRGLELARSTRCRRDRTLDQRVRARRKRSDRWQERAADRSARPDNRACRKTSAARSLPLALVRRGRRVVVLRTRYSSI